MTTAEAADELVPLSGGTFRALRQPNFRNFMIGQATSQVGNWMQLAALSVLILRLTDSGFAVSFVNVAQFGPILLLGPWAGVLSDRFDRHRLLVGLGVGALVASTVLAVLVVVGTADATAILAVTAAGGVLMAVENPIRRVFVGDLVPVEDVSNAVGLNAAVLTGAKVVGPALAGALIVGPGIEWCFILNALSYVPLTILFARLDRSRFGAVSRVSREAGQIRAGLRYAMEHREIRAALLMTATSAGAYANLTVLLPVYVARDLGRSAVTFTLLISTISAGMIVGALVVARAVNISISWLRRRAGVLGVGLVALAVAPSLAWGFVAAVLIGVVYVQVSVGTNALLQIRAESELRGRVLALLSVVTVGTAPLLAPALGALTDRAGARWAIAASGLLAASGSLAAWFTPARPS